ncbi:PREDICTED: phosphatidylinositol 3,4,5-trisphosphate-dependent Rac exchanger 2 protein-like [Branchiostoma belcheri]|uniref:Phosphatidylinositol 3,4,5-trisphosphate-dependent Rac exchanger 2 protein-like n=3 Tax=Branchiostoma belcheri TaxID=7741 RepID=A0A6P4YBR0_BRABE|nr:PREDICTED: phosphatidylinositol 3,4,5-trisphosphate-dependent Rac exchanger 2 protein-like [Branchiostoma belcheri]
MATGEAKQTEDPAQEKRDRMRVHVIKEILKTEEDYVHTLEFLVTAFLKRMRSRMATHNDKLITEETIWILFSNIEQLLTLHQKLLSTLKEGLQPEPHAGHEVGACFLKHLSEFSVYEMYCSNHEKAQWLLLELQKDPNIKGFLLACMLLGGHKTTDVPLEGYLLSPIQRICKYPLLLKELLKQTVSTHPDIDHVKSALVAMKDVCSKINETKRRMESLEALEEWQSKVEGWEGSNITNTCTELIKQGMLLKISAGNVQERVFFLCDNLLVYCKKIPSISKRVIGKKTLTKRQSIMMQQLQLPSSQETKVQYEYIFRGRISTELMEIENIEDGTADFHSSGYTVTNGWKVHNNAKNKWFVCIAKTPQEKQEWLEAIYQEREKRRSVKQSLQRDTWNLISEKGERLYHLMNRNTSLIRDRKHHLRTYHKCFVGSEFVSWLKELGEINSVEEGVHLGQLLLENGIIHHVVDKHHFKNEPLLYRFRYDDGTYKGRSEMQDMIAKGIHIYCRLHGLFNPLIKNKDHYLRTHKSVMVASRLVDWLVEQGDCKTREEAVMLGQALCDSGFMHHVLEKYKFKDDSLLFRFYADEELEGIAARGKQPATGGSGAAAAAAKMDFRQVAGFMARTLAVPVHDGKVGFHLEKADQGLLVVTVADQSPAQKARLYPGMMVKAINGHYSLNLTSSNIKALIKAACTQSGILNVTVAAQQQDTTSIVQARQDLGFQVRGSNPCVVHLVKPDSPAGKAGLFPGQSILQVNGKDVSCASHDTVVCAIKRISHGLMRAKSETHMHRMGKSIHRKRLSPVNSVQETFRKDSSTDHVEPSTSQEPGGEKSDSNGASPGDKSPSSPRPLSQTVTTPTNKVTLQVQNSGLEHYAVYEYEASGGVRYQVLESMKESDTTFTIPAKLVNLYLEEDQKFLAELEALPIPPRMDEGQKAWLVMAKDKWKEILQRKIKAYQKFSRLLSNHIWPSFKAVRMRQNPPLSMDFCPMNCHLQTLDISEVVPTLSLPQQPQEEPGTEDTEPPADGSNPVACEHTACTMVTLAAPAAHAMGLGKGGLQDIVGGTKDLQDSMHNILCVLESAVRDLDHKEETIIKVLSGDQHQMLVPVGCVHPPLVATGSGSGDDLEANTFLEFEGIFQGIIGRRASKMVVTKDKVVRREMDSFLAQACHLWERLRGEDVDEALKEVQRVFPCRDFRGKLHDLGKVVECYKDFLHQHEGKETTIVVEGVKTLVGELTKVAHELRHIMFLGILAKEDPTTSSRRDVVFSQALSAAVYPTTSSRRDVVFSQALSAAVCAFSEQLLAALNFSFNNMKEYKIDNKLASIKWLEQTASIGVLVMFQAMLSPNWNDEKSILQDLVVGVSDLDKVTFIFRTLSPQECHEAVELTHSVEGTRSGVQVVFYLKKNLFLRLPRRLQAGSSIKMCPVLFNQALVNLHQSWDVDFVNAVQMQNNINQQAIHDTQAFYRRFKGFHLDKSKLPGNPSAKVVMMDKLLRPLNSSDELLRQLDTLVMQGKKKQGFGIDHGLGVGLVSITAEFCFSVGACRLLMCNTGIHRTSCAATLEQSIILTRCHGLPSRYLATAAHIIKNQGVRVQNEAKNPRIEDNTPAGIPRLYSLCQDSGSPEAEARKPT